MKIALMLEHGATAFGVAATLDMLRVAERFQPGRGWSPIIYSAHGGTIHLLDGLAIQTQPMPASLGEFDALILPGFFAESAEDIVGRLQTTWSRTVESLRRVPAPTMVAASCFGTFALAEAGMLDGLPATTTWWFADAFRQRYPSIKLDADEAVVDSGRVITAGAMTAHTDLMLHVLRRLGGAELARRVGSIMLVNGARTSQRPFMSVQRVFADPLVDRAVEWLEKRLAQPVSIDQWAEALHISYRTLNRRFSDVVGMAPLAYMQALRVERAKELLEISRTDFETITEKVGYGDVSSFRRLFKRATGLSPTQYRRQFRRNETQRG